MELIRSIIVGLSACAAGCLAGCIARPAEPTPDPEPVVRTARLVFVGDVMSHAPQVLAAAHAARTAADTLDVPVDSPSALSPSRDASTACDDGRHSVDEPFRPAKPPTGYDYSEVFRHVRPIFERVDIAVANLETTLRSTPPYTGYPMFAAPAELAFDLREAGIDIVTTANNHICDKGARGIRSTLAILDSAGIRHTGAFLDSTDRRARNPLRFEAGGLRFALLAYTYGTNGLPVPKGMMVNLIDTAVIARDLAVARTAGTDCVVVSYHWGDEYSSAPSRIQRELAAWTRAHGADLIIGTHPHVVQPIEPHYNVDSTAVMGATYYSLGNFVSNQRGRRTDGGIAAEISVVLRDSLPLGYDAGWRLAWVHTPYRDGIRRYEVLPAAALDTLPEPALSAAQRFTRDTRALLPVGEAE